jgi:ribosomal protein S18 acetylase RimI-like enzyme
VQSYNNISHSIHAAKTAMKATWRIMNVQDNDSVATIASKVHPGLPERDEVFAQRITLFPDGCYALVSSETTELVGYIISHPIHYRQPPALDSLLEGPLTDLDQYYIHDLALLPEYQGCGYAREIMEILSKTTKRYTTISLVSVYGTAKFWAKYGFLPVEDESLKVKLLDYGEDAVFLERKN